MNEEGEMETEWTEKPLFEDLGVGKRKMVQIYVIVPSEEMPAEEKDVKKDKNKPLTKVVIRRLPPRLTKEAFTEEFSPLPPHDYFHFVRGDLSLGSHSFSRAYINFINQEDIFAFKEKYDDYGIQDDKGKTYHAVVEFAPFQRVPKRNTLKKKLSKAGTLESDPKYLEFLKKLEEYKNNATNTSEYFHETESPSLKAKITTTPLLEYLKAKKQKKNDLKNDMRPRKRETERERKRKEDEKRKAERRKEEKKNSRYDEKNKVLDEKPRKSDERLKDDRKSEIRGRSKDEKKDCKNWKDTESYVLVDDKSDVGIPTDPAILHVVMRQPEKSNDKDGKTHNKILSVTNDENSLIKSAEIDPVMIKNEKKYSDFRTRLAEEKQKKTFHKKDADESKTPKSSSRSRKGVPDEKGDNCSIGNYSDIRECGKKNESDLDVSRKDSKTEHREAKSKYRYSEQRNREREYRNQKASDWKKDGLIDNTKGKSTAESRDKEGKDVESSKSSNAEDMHKCNGKEDKENNGDKSKNRRRSLELEKKLVEGMTKRSRSFHDLSNKKINDLGTTSEKKCVKTDNDNEGSLMGGECETTHTDDGSKESNGSEKAEDECKKDVRAERRIRNKDRPSMEIYRPGMGKFSKQRLEQKKEETNYVNPSSTQNSVKNNRISNKPSKRSSVEPKLGAKPEKSDDLSSKNNSTPTKTPSEVRTMTFTRSGSKEN